MPLSVYLREPLVMGENKPVSEWNMRGILMQWGEELTCWLWNSLMSQCHVHSHLNLMSAQLRQQVALMAVHLHAPVFLYPAYPTPSTKHRMWHGDRVHAFGICSWQHNIIVHLDLNEKPHHTEMDGAFLHLCPLQWCHPRSSWKGLNMTSLHPNRYAEEIVCICALV